MTGICDTVHRNANDVKKLYRRRNWVYKRASSASFISDFWIGVAWLDEDEKYSVDYEWYSYVTAVTLVSARQLEQLNDDVTTNWLAERRITVPVMSAHRLASDLPMINDI